MKEIRFGTSGWRGVIADDFTFESARLACAAIAAYLWETREAPRGVVVGYDGRFQAEEFARQAAEEMTARGIDVLLCDRMVPTPVLSHLVLLRGLAGAVNFTASHNPARYQGIKFNPSWGGPALPAATGRIEEIARSYQANGLPAAGSVRGRVSSLDPVPEYVSAMHKVVRADRIVQAGIPLVYDALYGAGSGFLERVLEESGGTVAVIHGWRDPLFGGESPDPSRERLSELSGWARKRKALGLATDGDADRFGIVGQEGEFYSPNEILALLADYLLGIRKLPGDLARSVATTTWLDTIAASYGRRCHETPVGFKYIGEMIARGQLALGGEESAGLTIRNHVPEKDGILACLLVAEMVAVTGQGLSYLRQLLEKRYGPRYSRRADIAMEKDASARLAALLKDPPLKVGARKAEKVLEVDGTKWFFANGEWALLRLSGTEPVARLYTESRTQVGCLEMEAAIRAWIGSNQPASRQIT